MRLNSSTFVKGVVILCLWLMPRINGQVMNPNAMPARLLDLTLQDYAYRAMVHPITGIPYDGVPPPEYSGIKISALRLRSGSLYRRGVESYREFRIPVGLREQPYVERLVLVYQNIGNWSHTFYSLPTDYALLAPVLGLLAYNGSDISAVELAELDLWASEEAIKINFRDVSAAPAGLVAKCAWFDFDALISFTDVVNESVCVTNEQGHFSIVGVPAGQQPPAKDNNKKGKYSVLWQTLLGILVPLFLFVAIVSAIVWQWKSVGRERNSLSVNAHGVQMIVRD